MEQKAPDQESIETLVKTLGLPVLIARILVRRGMSTPEAAQAFLSPRLEHLSDPFLLPDVEKGVDRLIRAIRGGEQVCLYGDYDADGVSSIAVMASFLAQAGVKPLLYIPERREGYGLHVEALKGLKERGARLVISLDCGSSNNHEIKWASEQGMDVVVIDHHEVPATLPPAVAVINPKRSDSRFPTRELAACGVVFFFLLALRRVMHSHGLLPTHVNLKRELDIVTLGTLGDMVPLRQDNRIITKIGVEVMRSQPRIWLDSFFRKKLLSRGTINEHALNFVIIPRINAAGRVSHPMRAFDFLACTDEEQSLSALSVLNDANRQRQRIEETTLNEIGAILSRDGLLSRNSIVLFKEGWHAGVIGIVAQKLTEKYGKPSIIITRVDGTWKGSGRGGEGVDLYGTVSSLAPLLLKFGGHKYACGLSIEEENLLSFRDGFDNAIGTVKQGKRWSATADTEARFEDLTAEVVGFMERLAPFGVGNPRPALLLRPASITGAGKYKVKMADGQGRTWYGWMPRNQSLPQHENVSIIASPSIREEMGTQFIQLNIKGFLHAGDPTA